MKSFRTFLTEEIQEQTKLKHLSHPEDLVFSGHRGFHQATSLLDALHNKLQGGGGQVHVQIKWDSSPGLVFGHHPRTGKFFVGTKSVFNVKKPLINYTSEDIEKNHPSEELQKKLKVALEHLPKVTPPTGVYHAGMMYSKEDVKDKDNHYSFTPNVLTYKVPKESEHGKKIVHAKIGIVPMYRYHGYDLPEMTASLHPEIEKFGQHLDVHIIKPDTDLSKIIYHPNARQIYNEHMQETNKLHEKIKNVNLSGLPQQHINKYINQTVRKQEKPSVRGFQLYAKDQPKLAKHIEENKDTYEHLFNLHHHLQKAKNALVDALDSHSSDFQHTLGEIPGHAEGYVVTLPHGQPLKLVRRDIFSRFNLLQSPRRKQES